MLPFAPFGRPWPTQTRNYIRTSTPPGLSETAICGTAFGAVSPLFRWAAVGTRQWLSVRLIMCDARQTRPRGQAKLRRLECQRRGCASFP